MESNRFKKLEARSWKLEVCKTSIFYPQPSRFYPLVSSFYLLSASFFLILLTSLTSQAQTLPDYLQMAGENNPELKAYFNGYLSDMEKVPQVGSLPDPELTMGFFLQPMERFMGVQKADVRLMQMFPWFGMLGTQKNEATKMAQAKYQEFQDAKNRLFFDVKITWYEMYQLEQEIRITKENLEILKTYERMALIRFQSGGGSSASVPMSGGPSKSTEKSASSGMGMSSGNNSTTTSPSTQSMNAGGVQMSKGKSGMSDVLRIRMEINALENELAQLEDNRLPLRAEFNQLLNRQYNEPITIADTLSMTVLSIERLSLLDSITQNNPMLKMLDAEVEAIEARKKMAVLEGRPMFGAGLNYMPFGPRMDNGVSMGGNDMFMPMVSMTIPIYRKKYSSQRKEAELKQQSVQMRRTNTVNQLTTEWSSSLRNLDDATRRTKFYQAQSELATQTLSLLMTSYATDGQDFEDVLRVQQQLLNYQLSLITAITDQHRSLAMLEALAATELNY